MDTSGLTSEQLVKYYMRMVQDAILGTKTTPRTPVRDTIGTGDLTQFLALEGSTLGVVQRLYDSLYISESIDQQTAKVTGLNDEASRYIYQMRQLILEQTYKANYYRFLTDVMAFTTFVTVLCLALVSANRRDSLSTSGLVISITAILTGFTLGMVYVFSTINKRTKSDWNHFYFPPLPNNDQIF